MRNSIVEKLLQSDNISLVLLNSLLEETDTDFILSDEEQKQLIPLFKNSEEEDLWDLLLNHMDCSCLSDDVIQYLFQNKIALISLCHLPLKDKWLKKLIPFDEEALIQLSERFYLSDSYSDFSFAEFYCRYLSKSESCIRLLLDHYDNSPKRELLLYLCKSDPGFQQFICPYVIADSVSKCADPDKIRKIFNECQQNPIILMKIANNYFSPEDVLSELTKTKNCASASSIRQLSKHTMEIKTMVSKDT